MQGSRLRVLVVDDDFAVRFVTCRMFGLLEHEAVAAESGAKAIDLLGKEQFDLAVVDTRMPGINGDDVRRFIRQHFPQMRIITASGTPSEEVRETLEEGRHVFLQKPYHLHQLRAAIEQLRPAEGRTEPPTP